MAKFSSKYRAGYVIPRINGNVAITLQLSGCLASLAKQTGPPTALLGQTKLIIRFPFPPAYFLKIPQNFHYMVHGFSNIYKTVSLLY